MEDEGKAVGCVSPTALLFVEPRPAYIRHEHTLRNQVTRPTAEM